MQKGWRAAGGGENWASVGRLVVAGAGRMRTGTGVGVLHAEVGEQGHVRAQRDEGRPEGPA